MKQMTLIEMDGFLKGKCIPRDLKVNETSAEYLVRKFAELESKLETALRECRSAGITIDNLEVKCAALLDELDKWKQESSAWQAVAEKQLALAASADQKIAELESLIAPQLPQPVVPNDAATAIRACLDEFPEDVRDIVEECASIAENACRAAMLQSGNFRENKNSSTNYPVIPSEVLSAILKVAKIRADFDDFDGDRRGIGDCLDEAEQELIVTINKYASQLAAEPIATNDVREQTAIPPVPVIQADVAQAIEKLKRKLVECNRYNYCADAVKGVEYDCHAAMLQCADDSIAHEGKNRPEDKLGMVDHFGGSNNMVEPVTDNTNQQFESLAKSK